MSEEHGWYKIYLFYGLIFFLLGFAGRLLNSTPDWKGLGCGFDNFTADLRQYTDWGLDQDNHQLAVLARPVGTPVDFLYSASLLEAGFEPLVRRWRTTLHERFVNLKMQIVKDDFDEFWQHQATLTPGRLVVGLNVIRPHPVGQEYQVEVKLGGMALSPVPLMQQAAALLADGSQLSLGLRRDNGQWLEISWREARPDPTGIGKVIDSLLELLLQQVSQQAAVPKLQ